MSAFEEKEYGKILNGDGRKGQNEMSKNVSRNSSSDTASIKGIFCFYILQISSEHHITLLLLQFQIAAEYISTQSTKQLNEVIYGVL